MLRNASSHDRDSNSLRSVFLVVERILNPSISLRVMLLTTAINKYVFVTIKQRSDEKLRVGYTRTEIVDTVTDIQHELIREAFRTTGITEAIEITTMGDIPAGSGL